MKNNKCKECGIATKRPKFCSRLCVGRFSQKKNKEKIKEWKRQRLLSDPIGERARLAASARRWRAKHPDNARKFQRNANGVVMEPTPEDIMFYGYKEPLRKFEGGFGYQGVLMTTKDKERVQCHFCGMCFRSLNNGHLMNVHKLTAAQYKTKVGLSQQTALVGESTRKKLIDRGWNPNHMEELKKAQQRRRERIAKGLKDKNSGFKLSLEKKNERGTCPDQLLDIIDKTVKSFGRIPTGEEFTKFHNGKYMGSVRNTYGTWTNALLKLGHKTHHSESWTQEKLAEPLKNFYAVHQRTPRWSDFRRGLLPNPSIYYKHFKNLDHARVVAGVPILVNLGGRRTEEWMPTKEERNKLLAQFSK